MSYLLPQFKCLPDTFSFHSRTLLHPPSTQPSSKHREATNFQVQCMLSVTSLSPPASITTTTLIDLEKLRLLSSDAHSNSSVADRPWTYVDTAAQPIELNYGSRLTKENLLTSEEAIIAAASAEAVALAKAAARFAKNAAMSHSGGTDLDDTFSIMPSDARGRQVGSSEPIAAATVSGETFPQHCHVKGTDDTKEGDDTQTMGDELELLQEQISNSPVMRSKRKKERKTRRVRGTEKDAANIVSVKSGSTRKKKRPSVQDVDYSDPLRYHRGTASSKLLTATEEQELSRGIQELIKFEKLQDELTHRCGAEPTFAQCAAAAGVDKKTLRKRISYGTICRDRMVKSNIRLVISIAKNYQGAGMNLQDLVQEGCRGLLRGTEKFDASKGFKFSTYAHWWIKQAVRKSLSDQSRTIRLPIHMVEATYRVKEAKKQLYSENGKHPNNEEVAKAAGLSMKKLQAVLLTPKAPRSLDQKIGFNMDLRPSDVISDPEAETSEELLIKQFMRQDLDKVLNTLSPRENQVIRWRFGLEDSRMRTLQEIGELLGVSRERIRQIETSAFRKLKNKRRTKNLQQYLISQA